MTDKQNQQKHRQGADEEQQKGSDPQKKDQGKNMQYQQGNPKDTGSSQHEQGHGGQPGR